MRRSCGVSEAEALVFGRRVAQPLEHPGGRQRVEQRLAGGDAADAVDEVGAADLLEHVARGAGHDRVEQRLVVGERRQHQAAQLGMDGAQLAAHLDAGAVGQADVEHGDVGMARGIALERLGGRAGLADDLDVVGGLEQLAHARGGRPRGRRAGTPGSRRPSPHRARHVVPDLRRRRPSSLGACATVRVRRAAAAAAAARRRDGDRLRARPARRSLRRITEAAAELVDARYGALGVLDETGTRAGRVHHRRPRRRPDRAASATCPRATASSGCSSSTPSRCACPTSRPPRQLRLPARPPADDVVPRRADPCCAARSSATST